MTIKKKMRKVWHAPGAEALWTLLEIKVKVKCSRYRPGVAKSVDRGIALLFHDRGTRMG